MPFPTATRFVRIAGLCVLALGLGACSDAKKTLGLEREAPDEFAVVPRAKLEVPPGRNLVPPRPGASRPQEAATSEQALRALTGRQQEKLQQSGFSDGEMAFLKQAGAEQANPDIRTLVNRETSAIAEEERSFTDRLVFWEDRQPAEGPLVNPTREAQRLRENQALGRPVTEGPTPQIERRRKALLEGIF